MTLYRVLGLVELWSLRVLALGSVWAALALFVPTAEQIEIAWTEVAFVGLVYGIKILALRWDLEVLRRRRGLNGELKLISEGHLVLRGIGATVQAINFGVGVAALLTEAPAREDVSVLALLTAFGLIVAGILMAVGCWYAEHNLAQQVTYRRHLDDLTGVPIDADMVGT